MPSHETMVSYNASVRLGFTANLKLELRYCRKKIHVIMFLSLICSCENRNTCTITADDATFGYPLIADPCPNTGKYLEVSYLCEPGMFIDNRSSAIQVCYQCESLISHCFMVTDYYEISHLVHSSATFN